jgi:hypothetical protein
MPAIAAEKAATSAGVGPAASAGVEVAASMAAQARRLRIVRFPPAVPACGSEQGRRRRLGRAINAPHILRRSKHWPGADTPDHLAVTGCHWRSRRRRSVANTIHNGADAIAGTDHGLAVSGQRWSCRWCPAPSTSALLNHDRLIGVDQIARRRLIARLLHGGDWKGKERHRITGDAVIAASRRWWDGGRGLLGCRATGQSANRGGEDHLFRHLCSYRVEEC